jgi:hypothetical protein
LPSPKRSWSGSEAQATSKALPFGSADMSHRRAVRSPDPVGTRPPSELNATVSRAKRPPHPETRVVDPVGRGVPGAAGRTEVLRIEVPGTAADDALIATTSCFRRTIRGRPVVVILIAVLNPFPDIANHVVKTECIRLEGSNRCRLFVIPFAAAAPTIGVVFADFVIGQVWNVSDFGSKRTRVLGVTPVSLSANC